MNEFKSGDRVRCINQVGAYGYVHEGSEWEIAAAGDGIVFLVGCPAGDKHRASRFELIGAVQPDPYNPFSMSPEKRQEEEASIVGVMYGETEIGVRNRKAREQMVTALAAEMRKEVGPRFPPEGRSDRVYQR